MNEVKGGIVIEQLKGYAKRLSDHTGDSVNIELSIWYHRHDTGNNFDVKMSAWDSSKKKRIEPFPGTEDLRNLGSVIDEIIRQDK